MRCPTLDDLPEPLTPGTGWPWTEESAQLPDTMPNNRPWPRVSMVTPSYNQGQFLEETIRSVLLQGYPDLEYMIMDGGSSDESVEIIQRYAPWLAYWKSEPDQGQTHALNRGWARATGDIYAWINSDDLLVPGALGLAANALSDRGAHWICGGASVIDTLGREVAVEMPRPHLTMENMIATWERPSYSYPQMSSYVTAEVVESAGPLRENLAYVMDHEYWMRLVSLGYDPRLMQTVLSRYRLHEESKTVSASHRFIQEAVQVADEYRARLRLQGSAVRRSIAHGRALAALEKMKLFPLDGSRWAVTSEFLRALPYCPRLLSKRSTLAALWRVWTGRAAKGRTDPVHHGIGRT